MKKMMNLRIWNGKKIYVTVFVFLIMVFFCFVNENNMNESSNTMQFDEEFYLVEGDWVITEYIDHAVESHELYNEAEEYLKEYEQRSKQLIEKYIGTTISINDDNIEFFGPITELGYNISDLDILFSYIRQPATLNIKAPFIGINVQLNESDESYKYIIDADGKVVINIKNIFFRVEKK